MAIRNLLVGLVFALVAAPDETSAASASNEFQLVGQAAGQARLPCLVGKPAVCGGVYFIAWYKLNSTSRQWSRFETRAPEAGQPDEEPPPYSGRGAPLADRAQFAMARAGSFAGCQPGEIGPGQWLMLAPGSSQKSLSSKQAGGPFDCGQLTMNSLDLTDEGQYKCEITFNEMLDPERCPTSTMTQLNVIARPNAPEIFVNGRPAPGRPAFKEGAQVRLECQSAGGKPAPRIEWLNLTRLAHTPDVADDDQSTGERDNRRPGGRAKHKLRLMRSQWPIKRASYSIGPAELSQSNSIQQPAGQIPLTSTSITITASRFDLNSRFVCLVQPAGRLDGPPKPPSSGPENQLLAELPAGVRDPDRLAELLARVAELESPVASQPDEEAPLLKWTKLDVLAKPSSVSIRVLDLGARGSQVQPSQPGPSKQPIYALHPNRLYAIQCLAEGSRPRSQVAWFNRTAPVELEQEVVQPDGPDYLLPAQAGRHRLTSFVRYAESEGGTFRTIASLLLTTSFRDNLDELFCRVSNEAFQFDELVQVAPIISARLHVNYPPSAWLEGPNVKWPAENENPTRQQILGRLSAEVGQRVHLRCHVGANPLMQNTILQIDWLRDGRPLASNGSRQQTGSDFQIEKTNHLHMPLADQTPAQLDLANRISGPAGEDLALLAGRLLASSSLTINSLARQDAGQYSCQFKLISALGGVGAQAGPLAGPHQFAGQPGQQAKMISGQASQAIQLNVIEAKLPLVQISSSAGLLLYDQVAPARGPRAGQPAERQNLEVVVTSRRARLAISCDFDSEPARRQAELGRKVLWQLNGEPLHSSPSSRFEVDLERPASELESSIAARLLAGNGGRLSCAHQMLEQNSILAAPGNFHAQAMRLFGSSNELDLRFKVEPKLVQTSRPELLMPPLRSFSELELVSQPLNRLRLVCLAQCEPLCSIEWLVNGQPVRDHHQAEGELEPRPSRTEELADNQTQIFKSARRVGPNGLGDSSGLLQIENLIHRKTQASSERFPWYKQTSLISGQLPEASQFELASRQLMSDSYELIQSGGPEAKGSNVFSKLELSFNRLSQMLALAAMAHGRPDDELLIECQPSEFLEGPHEPVQFGHARVPAGKLHPARAADSPAAPELGPHAQPATEQAGRDFVRVPLDLGPLGLVGLFAGDPSQAAGGQKNRHRTRVVLERSLKPDLPFLRTSPFAPPNSSQVGPADVLAEGDQLRQSTTSRATGSQAGPDGPQVSPSSSGGVLSPPLRAWLLNHLELLLVVVCAAAIVWLVGLFVSPLLRRHFSRSPSSSANMLAAKQARNSSAHWRLSHSASRASSNNELGGPGALFGSAHKFNLGPNYYGAPDSGGDSSEHDMVQSCSQSSHYEDFIQHQLQQRLAQQQQQQQQQPLYFNQNHHQPGHLVESTTLSRRPLMKSSYSSSSTGGETSGSSAGSRQHQLGSSRIYGDLRQIQQQTPPAAATMRHQPSQQAHVPLISNSTKTSSRINFADLQQVAARPRSRLDRLSGQQTFGKATPSSVPSRDQYSARPPNLHMHEHIYDDVI